MLTCRSFTFLGLVFSKFTCGDGWRPELRSSKGLASTGTGMGQLHSQPGTLTPWPSGSGGCVRNLAISQMCSAASGTVQQPLPCEHRSLGSILTRARQTAGHPWLKYGIGEQSCALAYAVIYRGDGAVLARCSLEVQCSSSGLNTSTSAGITLSIGLLWLLDFSPAGLMSVAHQC